MKTEINEFKYKGITFIIFILAIIVNVLGLMFFRDIHFIITASLLTYTILKYTQMAFILLYANFRYSESMESFRKRQIEKYESTKEITHVFILPNYC